MTTHLRMGKYTKWCETVNIMKFVSQQNYKISFSHRGILLTNKHIILHYIFKEIIKDIGIHSDVYAHTLGYLVARFSE